jgi:hypothetical protein
MRSTEKPCGLIGNSTHDLPAYSIMSQPIMLSCAPENEMKISLKDTKKS